MPRRVPGRAGNLRNDDIRSNEQRAFEIVALAIEDEEIHYKGGYEERDGFKEVEVERHGAAQTPSEDDDEGSDEEC
jgi:hypothetical protein